MAKNILLYIEKSLIINREENNFMKIAVATEGTNVSGHLEIINALKHLVFS